MPPPPQDDSSKPQNKGQWNHMIAGGVAGSVAVLFLHPFDVIKTRLQVQDGANLAMPTYRNALHAVKSIAKHEGWTAFYKGLTPAIIGSGVSWAAYFYIYEAIKSWHMRAQGKDRLSPGWNMASAAQAGAMVCLMTNPIWLVKTRLQLQMAPSLRSAAVGAASSTVGATAPLQHYKGFVDALVRIGREEGLKGYYKGLKPSLVLQTMHGAIQFTVYEELKFFASRFGSKSPEESDRTVSTAELSLFAACSKLTASVSTYPSQVVRSRLQQRMDGGRAFVYNNATEVIKLTWKREGFRGFYKGIGPALLRVMPQSAVTLVIYENVLKLLNDSGNS